MWLKAQNEMAGLWPHAAMGPVERMVRHRRGNRLIYFHQCICEYTLFDQTLLARTLFRIYS